LDDEYGIKNDEGLGGLMANIKAGICEDCGSYWTVTSGGLNDDGQCPECERRYPVQHDGERPSTLDEQLAEAGTGLGI